MREDTPEIFAEMPEARRAWLLNWISENLAPRDSFNTKHTSYGIKQRIRDEKGEHVHFFNGEFKGAMLEAGYRVQDPSAQNWVFNVSERSPLLSRRLD